MKTGDRISCYEVIFFAYGQQHKKYAVAHQLSTLKSLIKSLAPTAYIEKTNLCTTSLDDYQANHFSTVEQWVNSIKELDNEAI